MDKQRYMISDAATLVNVESHVLRYWEEELDLAIPRNEMGHRYYTKENIDQFFRIKEWKEQGYQLKAIKILIHNGGNEAELLGDATGETVQQAAGHGVTAPGGRNTTGHTMTTAGGNQAVVASSSVEDNTRRLEQFQNMMTEIVKKSIQENNQALSKEVSQQVRDYVLKEMNYLMREQDEAEEERYKKLDELIRQSMKTHVKKDRKLFRRKAELNPTGA